MSCPRHSICTETGYFTRARRSRIWHAAGLGATPSSTNTLVICAGDELVPYLVWRGLSVPAARRVGLLISGGRDHLAARIVFPEIRKGSPVWFIGRWLHESDDSPRYLG